ncbi:PREDICTED: uncharacterized protein LOC109464487 [Branchiostoma belcheri]|uniref:Uncharacterized protein LOC109464487 n=1 Tax=Branchiostoma belcheri TaxID=7741 RepID=A0A6P4XY52_BRABE|nr:PREDICTED: uncharacterized protein LOC109464487 [Branchiostoma belcheri]XP_019617054.1 PREDICTED: uncharacterized protein LOC109464487 [Branchiostoma belcheri]
MAMPYSEAKDTVGSRGQLSQNSTSLEMYSWNMETWKVWCLYRLLQARREARGYPDVDSTTPKIVDVRSITIEEFDRMGKKARKRSATERSRETTTSRPPKVTKKSTENATSPPKSAERPKRCTKNVTSSQKRAEKSKRCTKNAMSLLLRDARLTSDTCVENAESSPSKSRPDISAKNADAGGSRSSKSCVQNADDKPRKRTHGTSTSAETDLRKQRKIYPGQKAVGKTSGSHTAPSSVPTSISNVSTPASVACAAQQKPASVACAAQQKPSAPRPQQGVETSRQRPSHFWQPWQDHTYFRGETK